MPVKTDEQYREEVEDVTSVTCGYPECDATMLLSGARAVIHQQVESLKATKPANLTVSMLNDAGACFCESHAARMEERGANIRHLKQTIAYIIQNKRRRDEVVQKQAEEKRQRLQEAEARARRLQEAETQMLTNFTFGLGSDDGDNGSKLSSRARRALSPESQRIATGG